MLNLIRKYTKKYYKNSNDIYIYIYICLHSFFSHFIHFIHFSSPRRMDYNTHCVFFVLWSFPPLFTLYKTPWCMLGKNKINIFKKWPEPFFHIYILELFYATHQRIYLPFKFFVFIDPTITWIIILRKWCWLVRALWIIFLNGLNIHMSTTMILVSSFLIIGYQLEGPIEAPDYACNIF